MPLGRPDFRVGPLRVPPGRRGSLRSLFSASVTPRTRSTTPVDNPARRAYIQGMNIDDALDTAASEAHPTNWLRLLVIPLLVATIAGTVSLAVGAKVFQNGSRSTQLRVESGRAALAQKTIVADKLTLAYNAFSTITPAGSTFGSLTTAEKQQLEYAMRDVYLYGDSGATAAVDKWFKTNFKSPVEGVLLPLRNQIRSLTGLGPSKQTSSPWIQTYWRTDASMAPTTVK